MDEAGQQLICGAPTTLRVYGIKENLRYNINLFVCAVHKVFFISCQDHLVKLFEGDWLLEDYHSQV